jgi:hypothetical protein
MGRNNKVNREKQQKLLDNHNKKVKTTKETTLAKKKAILELYKASLKENK